MTREYTIGQLAGGPDKGKWAVLRDGQPTTRGGSERAAQGWANFMNRVAGDQA